MTEIFKLLLVIKNSLIANKHFCLYNYFSFEKCLILLNILYFEGLIITYINNKKQQTLKIIFSRLLNKKNLYIFNILNIYNKKAFPVLVKYKDLVFFHSSIDLLILSTTQGIIPHYKALKYKIGGRVICYLR